MSKIKNEEDLMNSNNSTTSSLNATLGIANNNSSSTTSGSTDFVKKLFLMLEDNNYRNVVRWTTNGDSFVVLDTNEFTKEILPKHFKHSNFASFVRQLNKYDFHKVKLSNEEKQQNEYGEGAWEFKHPDFKIHDRDSLETIKRKGPAQKRNADEQSAEQISRLEDQVRKLTNENQSFRNEMKVLNSRYTTVIESVVSMKNTNDSFYRSFNALVSCLLQQGIKLPQLDLPVVEQNVLQLQHSANASQRMAAIPTQQQQIQTGVSGSQKRNSISQQSATQQQSQQQPTTQQHQQSSSGTHPSVSINLCQGFHVLLVEDDAVCIQLCRKFLVKFGCTVEVATDGLTAISALENQRYDIVFMDIIMPNLDGATATAIIRGFDDKTPIIAMTGNIQNQDLVNYLQHGMSDILAKPFTKDDLYLMLEKYLSNRTPLAQQRINSNISGTSNDVETINSATANKIVDGLSSEHLNKKPKI